jgi:hypothetical protein
VCRTAENGPQLFHLARAPKADPVARVNHTSPAVPWVKQTIPSPPLALARFVTLAVIPL